MKRVAFILVLVCQSIGWQLFAQDSAREIWWVGAVALGGRMPCTKPVKPFNPASSAPDFYYPAFGKRSVEHTHAFLKVGLEFPFNEYRAGWQMGGQPLVMRPGDKHHSWQALQSLVPLDRVAYFEKM